MNCVFEEIELGLVRCSICGREVYTADPPGRVHAHCKADAVAANARRPSLAKRLVGYATAVMRWKAAGSPLRTAAEVAAVLAICEACSHYRQHTLGGGCALCGCSLRGFGGLTGKAAMATEICPAGKW